MSRLTRFSPFNANGIRCLLMTGFGAVIFLFVLFLPAQSQAQSIRFAHCLMGCPVGDQQNNDVIARPIYTLSFNHETRVADWVAYVVSSGSIGVASNLSREPRPDPYIGDTLVEEDYTGAAEQLNLERNYLVPLVSFAGTPFWNDINYLTNMVPRNADLNRGSWYGLEWSIRNLANRIDAIYVITGPIYDADKPQPSLLTSTPHRVPSGFFKVVASRDGEMAAFVFDQDLPFHIHHCEQRTTVEEIEQMTGLDLFPEATDWPTGDLSSSLGCF